MGKITPLFGGKAGQPALEADEPVRAGLIGEMTASLVAAQNQVADSHKEERRLAHEAKRAARAAGHWPQRAMAAVRAGDDVIARDALLRQRRHEVQHERFCAAEKAQHQQTATLTRALATLNLRIEEAKHERNVVAPRDERAAALPAAPGEANSAAAIDPIDMQKRIEAKMANIETELELSDDAIANLAREAADALRTQDELARRKREASDPAPLASRPLAKTVPTDTQNPRTSASQAVGESGPPRTKR